MKRYFLVAISVLGSISTLSADTLILRDGSRVEGQLISVRDGVIEFIEGSAFGGGRSVRLSRNDVLGIEFNPNASNSGSFPAPNNTQGGGRPSGLRERQVTVAANVLWTDTNVVVQSGQDVFFEATGEINWGPGRRDGPGGEQNSPNNPNRPIPSRPGGALIGRVGEGSSDFFFIGTDRNRIRMRSSGRLSLGINDDVLGDNGGSFRVIVRY